MSSSTTSVLRDVDEKTAAMVIDQRESLLSRLQSAWEKSASQAKASARILSKIVPESDLSSYRGINTPEAETIKTTRFPEYRDALAAATFREDVERRVSDSIRFHTTRAPGKNPSNLVQVEMDLNSVFASNENDPAKWAKDVANDFVLDHTLNTVQNLTIGRPNVSYPSHMAQELIDTVLVNDAIEASKTTKGSEPSDFQRYIEDFENLSRPEVEAFYDEVTGKRVTSGPSFIDNPLKAFNHRFRKFAHYSQLEGRIPGSKIATSTEGGLLDPSYIEAARDAAQNTEEKHEKYCLSMTGKPSTELDDLEFLKHDPCLRSFMPSKKLVEGIDRTLLSNIQSGDPVSVEDLDFTEAFMNDHSKAPYSGLFKAMISIDKTYHNVLKISSAGPFFSVGAIFDQRPGDVRNLTLNLVDDTRPNAAKQMSDLWPKNRSDVSKAPTQQEEGTAELPEKYTDSLTQASLLY